MKDLADENAALRARLEVAEETLRAIHSGEVDALVVAGPDGDQVFTLQGADHPYRVAVEVMNEGLVTLGPDGMVLWCNRRFAEFVKTPMEQIIGRPIAEFVKKDARSALDAFLARARENSGEATTLTIEAAEGALMPVHFSAAPVRVNGTRALCVVVTDLTVVHTATETQLRLASIVEHSKDAIISKSLTGMILSWNAAAERMFGYSESEAIDQPISLIMPRDRMDELPSIAEAICLGKHIEGLETIRVKENGERIYVSLTLSPMMDARGNVTGISMIARDITERKKIEAKLENQRQHLEETVLQRTHELQAKTDELQAACEELQAQREELQSANEELSAQAEELQSQSEELATANQELRASHESEAAHAAELQAVLDTMSAAILIAGDAEAREMKGNHAAEDLLRVPHGANLSRTQRKGMKPGTFITMRNGIEIPPEDLPVQVAARERKPVHDFEYDVVFWDGSIRHLIGNATPLANGGAVGAFLDITDRKRAEEELQKLLSAVHDERDRFSAVLNSMADEVWFADPNGKFTLVNPSATREFQLDPAAPIGVEELADSLEVYRGDGSLRPVDEAPPLRALAGEVLWGEEEIIRTPGTGELRHRQVNAAPVRDASGNVVGSVSVVRDITDRKRAEEEIMRSNEELERFASVASHDLQEPLRQMAGFAKILGQEYRGLLDDDAKELLDFIVDGGHRAQGLIQDLLAYSRVGRGGRARTSTDLRELLDTTLLSLKTRIDETNAVITQDSMPTLEVDATQIGQVFQNLIGNALKFVGQGAPEIHVGARREGNNWLFSVKDNGIGFEPEYAEQIFEVFQRLHTREAYPGTGIGLPICKRVVENHGGHIWAESKPGEGATFYFTLSA